LSFDLRVVNDARAKWIAMIRNGSVNFRASLRGLSSRWRGKDKDAGRPAIVRATPMKRRGNRLLALATLLFGLCFGVGAAGAEPVGTATGLPLPRYASLKIDRVNLREGPSKDHAIKWVFQRPGLPVEITAEFEIWRKVRDSEGAEGWVLHSLLSGRRTALVAPGKKDQTFKIFAKPTTKSDMVATLQSGVIANVKNCDGAWCLVDGDGYKGYIDQVALWGVYPNEKVN
jgi:SH3-like domain-containing protein